MDEKRYPRRRELPKIEIRPEPTVPYEGTPLFVKEEGELHPTEPPDAVTARVEEEEDEGQTRA